MLVRELWASRTSEELPRASELSVCSTGCECCRCWEARNARLGNFSDCGSARWGVQTPVTGNPTSENGPCSALVERVKMVHFLLLAFCRSMIRVWGIWRYTARLRIESVSGGASGWG